MKYLKSKNGKHKVAVDDNVYKSLKSKEYRLLMCNRRYSLAIKDGEDYPRITVAKYVYKVNNIDIGNSITHYKDGNLSNCRLDNLVYGQGHFSSNTNKFTGVRLRDSGSCFAVVKMGSYRKTVGSYKTEIEAAIAYNKAMDIIKGLNNYEMNETGLDNEEYMEIYNRINVDMTIRNNYQGSNRKLKETHSVYTGVTLRNRKKKWQACIKYHGVIYLGSYMEEIEAAQAYNEAALLIYGADARINPVPRPLHTLIDIDKIREKIEETKSRLKA